MDRLEIYFSDTFATEKRYIAYLVFEWFMGAEVEYHFHDQKAYRVKGNSGELALPDVFFDLLSGTWLTEASLALIPPARVVSVDSSNTELSSLFDDRTTDESSPFFGTPSVSGGNIIESNIDFLGNIFFHVSRYEEYCQARSDAHLRYQAASSVLGVEDLLQRPLVNEFLSVLKTMLRRIGVRSFKTFRFSQAITCDIDFLSYPQGKNLFWKMVNLSKRAKSGTLVESATADIYRVFHSRFISYQSDHFNSFHRLVERAGETGSKMIFFLMSDASTTQNGSDYRLNDHRLEVVFDLASKYDFVEFGLHGSYHSYDSIELLSAEFENLKAALKSYSLDSRLLYSRQHFLRWNQRSTPGLLEKINVQCDSTLGYAESPGFRSSCCLPYPMYDLQTGTRLNLLELPLVLMDRSLLDSRYLGLENPDQALDLALNLKQECIKHNGVFTLLWHNSSFLNTKESLLFDAITQN